MKKITAIALTAAIMLSLLFGAFTFGASAGLAPLIGDTDGDNDITVSDALITMRAVAQLISVDAEELPVYDVWNDGEIGVDDALGVLRGAINLIGSFGRVGVKFTFTPTNDSSDLTQIMLDRAIVNTDGSARIANIMEKAAKGESITIVTLGGSITAGTGASAESKRYNNIVANWWKNNFTSSNVTLINKGVGATGSTFGVYRLQRDVLSNNPDLLIVEFAVNDVQSGNLETYENLIRRVLVQSPDTAVVALMMTTINEEDVQERLLPVTEYYGIPTISYKNAILSGCKDGDFDFRDFSDDGVHPNDRGYAVVAGMLDSYFKGVKDVYQDCSRVVPAVPEEPMTSERYMNAQLHWCSEGIEPTTLGGWAADTYGLYDYRGSWYAAKASTKPMKFTVRAKEIAIMYERLVDKLSSGKVRVSIDGGPYQVLDSWFEGGWGNYQIDATLYASDEVAEHTVSFTCVGGKFRIAALMLA